MFARFKLEFYRDAELEDVILSEKYTGSVFTIDMTKILIPEAGAGILWKLRKLANLKHQNISGRFYGDLKLI